MKYFDYNEILTIDIKNKIKEEYDYKKSKKRKSFGFIFIIGFVFLVIGISMLYLNTILILKLSLSIIFLIFGGGLTIITSFYPLIYPKRLKEEFYYKRLKNLGYMDLLE